MFVFVWYALLCVLPSFAIILNLVALLLLSYYCNCYVALPCGAVAWSALCDWGISG